MPTYDYRCPAGHVFDRLVPYRDRKTQECPECGNIAEMKFLTPPKLDWMGIGAQANASPEFIERFDKAHKERAKQEAEYKKEHGDAMRGAGG